MPKKTEHTETRLPLVDRMVKMGWKAEQLQYEPEWRVPKRPSEASKRELGHKFESWPIDIAVFDDSSHAGEYNHLLGLVETKAPDLTAGKNQLEIYLANEPYARFAFWTNGTERCLIFRLSDGSFLSQVGKDIPGPSGPFIFGGEKKIDWTTLQSLSVLDLRRILNRLLNAIVAQDTSVTRSEEQLNQLCNIILAKLHSDQRGKLKASGLRAFDLISPERASKNIGEFCVLMPGQESVVLTRETLTLRSTSKVFDQFYLMWAMSLHLVRAQWSRVVFMQTNREDVGSRYLEIVVPVPRSAAIAKRYGKPYRDYFNDLATLRAGLRGRLEADGFRHHVFFA